jgi:peroxiredoxin
MKQHFNKILTAALLSFLFLTGCRSIGKDGFTVTVNYKNLDKMPPQYLGDATGQNLPVKNTANPGITLQEIPYGGDMNPVIIDSASLSGNAGTVVLEGKAKEETIFQVMVENGPMLLLINDEEDIAVEIDLAKKDNYYTVSGSPASEQLREFISNYSEKSFVINRAFAEIDSLKQFGGSDSLLIISTEKKNKAVKQLNSYLQQFINKSTHPALSLFALGWSSRSFPKEDFESTLNAEVQKFPEHETLKKLKTTYDMQQAQLNSQQEKQPQIATTLVGKPAPELALPTPEGNIVSVSSFKGKYLLIDFWASWCGPCRNENPNVVKAFNQFKDKNFTILGVSLDEKKEPWLKAIKDDELAWTHISDLKFWDSQAVSVYGFDGIPYNVLVDPQGIIIAENLKGANLIRTLEEKLK